MGERIDSTTRRQAVSLTTRCLLPFVCRCQVCVGFYEKSVKKNFFFGMKEEKLFWERWIIPLALTSDKDRPKTQADRDRATADRHDTLVDNLLFLVSCVNEKKEHIPPMKSGAGVALAFSFEISFTTGEKTDESWGLNTIKVGTRRDGNANTRRARTQNVHECQARSSCCAPLIVVLAFSFSQRMLKQGPPMLLS